MFHQVERICNQLTKKDVTGGDNGMPLPAPKQGESQAQYVGRCIPFQMRHEKKKPKNKRRPAKQVQAMCFERYRQRGKSADEIITDLISRLVKVEKSMSHE